MHVPPDSVITKKKYARRWRTMTITPADELLDEAPTLPSGKCIAVSDARVSMLRFIGEGAAAVKALPPPQVFVIFDCGCTS